MLVQLLFGFLILLTTSHAQVPCANLVKCFADPCTTARCDAFPLATCTADYCGGCNTRWTLAGKTVNCTCNQVMCFVNPCLNKRCPLYPNATCTTNYCGGCNAIWKVNDVPVDCGKFGQCPVPPPTATGDCAELCASDSECPNIQKCCRGACGSACTTPLNPIKPGQCPPIPTGTTGICEDRCASDLECPDTQKCCMGSCGASCVAPAPPPPTKPGQCPVVPVGEVGVCDVLCTSDSQCPDVQKCCKGACGSSCKAPAPAPCPNPVECTINPCTTSKCEAFPLATCTADYCGGCNTKWTLAGRPVNCTCNKVECILNPCTNKQCPSHPNATCTANYCGGCNAVWKVNDVPVDCAPTLAKPGQCPLPTEVGTCGELCFSDSQCPDTQKCCRGACGSSCKAPMTPLLCNPMCTDGKRCVSTPNGPACVAPPPPPPTSCDAVRCAFGMVCVQLLGSSPTCVPNTGKPGQCPAVPAGQMGNCLEACSSDLQCSGTQKCCRGACGSSCMTPVIGTVKPGTCPTTLSLSAVDTTFSPAVCRSECSSDSDCADINKCCADGCNSVCLRPADTPCTSCNSAIRPLSPLRLCADGTSSEGFKCNLRTCAWEFVPCPACTSCPTLLTPLVRCSPNCTGQGRCALVGGVCASSWSCERCLEVPPPPPTTTNCIRAGCQGEKCVRVGDPITLECAQPSPRTRCLSLARCEANSDRCAWNYTRAYEQCVNGARPQEDTTCTTRDPCLCTSNPRCGYCLSSLTLLTGVSTPVGRCIPIEKADKCVAPLLLGGFNGQYLAQYTCPTVSTPVTAFLNKLNSISLTTVQTKLDDLLRSESTLSGVSCRVQTLLEAVIDNADGNVVTRAIVEVASSSTSEQLDKLCQVVGSSMASRPIDCKLTKIPPQSASTPARVPLKRDATQATATTPDTYLFEAKVANTDPDSATSTSATDFPTYGIALIVIAAVLVVVIVAVVVTKMVSEPEQF